MFFHSLSQDRRRVIMRKFLFPLSAVIMGWIAVASCSRTPAELVAKHTKRGDAYAKEGKYAEAVIEYKNAVKAGPKDAPLHFKLAKAALESKDLRTAFQEFQRVVELDPSHYEAKG